MLEVIPCAGEPDEQVALGIYNAVWPDNALTLEDLRSFKAGTRDHVHYVARLDGTAAGTAIGVILPQRLDRVFAMVTVLAAHRRRGAGSRLYEAVSAWTAERGLTELEVPVLDNDAESLAYAERRGFAEERRDLGFVLDLSEITPPEGEPPGAFEIVTWAERPELARGMYEVSLEALPDIPGFEEDEIESFDDWLAHDMQGSGDSPEATFVALAGEEVVGYAKFSTTRAQPGIAYHDLTAVKRAWRGRGVARALKVTQIRWALAHGYTELHTRNEERNEPIRRLNERFGYRPGIGRIYLAGPLSGA